MLKYPSISNSPPNSSAQPRHGDTPLSRDPDGNPLLPQPGGPFCGTALTSCRWLHPAFTLVHERHTVVPSLAPTRPPPQDHHKPMPTLILLQGQPIPKEGPDGIQGHQKPS